ncbi:uncharacterized protein V6R79_021804 [Siganus canaliculatus]
MAAAHGPGVAHASLHRPLLENYARIQRPGLSPAAAAAAAQQQQQQQQPEELRFGAGKEEEVGIKECFCEFDLGAGRAASAPALTQRFQFLTNRKQSFY